MERIAIDTNSLDHPPYSSSDKQHAMSTTFPQQRKISHATSEQVVHKSKENPKFDQNKFMEYCQREGKFKFTECSVCKKIVNQMFLSIYMIYKKSHKNIIKILICKYKACSTFFLTEGERQKHEEKVHSGRGKKKCMFCGLFYSPSFIVNHIKENHSVTSTRSALKILPHTG